MRGPAKPPTVTGVTLLAIASLGITGCQGASNPGAAGCAAKAATAPAGAAARRAQPLVTVPLATSSRRLTVTASSIRRSCVTSSSVPG